MIQIICDFCKQPIAPIIAKFRHEVSTANFMVGVLPKKEEICDICYTRAINNPPTKEEIDNATKKVVEDAQNIQMNLMRSRTEW